MSFRTVRNFRVILMILMLFLGIPSVFAKKNGDTAPQAFQPFRNLKWRNIGPSIMGGRLTDIEGVPGNAEKVYVASASGGLWKTENGGITWEPLFDKQEVLSIGDMGLDPRYPDIVWVGTGEDNPRNSVSYGNGVYRSTDGGKTWTHLGLENTERIARIMVHPGDSNIAWVAAIGHIFGPNPNRGVYLTKDGGKTWEKTLYIDEYHGAADLDVNPQNPQVVYATMWYFQRKPWDFDSGSDRGGVYRSTDGGRTWTKLTEGLPKEAGRLAVKVSPSNPKVVYVLAEAKEAALYRSDDGGDHFKPVYTKHNIVNRGFYYTELRVDPGDENILWAISSRLWKSIDGGKTFKAVARGIHVDFHTAWIDPVNTKRIWVGNDGGLAFSADNGETWEFVDNLPIGQFYQIHADMRQPFYYVCGGLQDNGTWCGPSRTKESMGIPNDFWYMVSFGDGFHVVSHPDDPEIYLSEYQAGGIVRTNMHTGEQQDVSPQPRRNDGGPVGELKYRFNWNAPIVLSPHDGHTVYFGANVVFRSKDFGSTWEVISPDLTTNDPEKQKGAGGPIFPENTTAEYHCTIISLAESPVTPGVIWVGTDDGNLQVTRDGGKTWTNVIRNVKGIPANSPVSHVEPSKVSADIVYVAFDRRMFDDFAPYIYRTQDGGKTWEKISGTLPHGAYVHVVREDPRKPNVLYAGTERGLYISWNGGKEWQPLRMKNLPPVAVHDILIHPRENDLILGTHGRGIWIFDDITPIQEWKEEVLKEPLHIFPIRPAFHFASKGTRIFSGDKRFSGPNPPYGALVTFYVKDVPEMKKEKDEREEKGGTSSEKSQKPQKLTPAKMVILDSNNQEVNEIPLRQLETGLNRVVWDLDYKGPEKRKKDEESQEPEFFYRGPRGPRVLPGTYKVKIKVGDYEAVESVEVGLAPDLHTPLDDLKAQLDISLEMRDMVSKINLTLRNLDGIHEQLENLQKTLKTQFDEPSQDVLKGAREHAKIVKELKERFTQEGEFDWGKGPRLLDQIQSLFFDVQGPFVRPTNPQMEFFGALKKEYDTSMHAVDQFLNDTLPKFNKILSEGGLPIIIPASKREKREDLVDKD